MIPIPICACSKPMHENYTNTMYPKLLLYSCPNCPLRGLSNQVSITLKDSGVSIIDYKVARIYHPQFSKLFIWKEKENILEIHNYPLEDHIKRWQEYDEQEAFDKLKLEQGLPIGCPRGMPGVAWTRPTCIISDCNIKSHEELFPQNINMDKIKMYLLFS